MSTFELQPKIVINYAKLKKIATTHTHTETDREERERERDGCE